MPGWFLSCGISLVIGHNGLQFLNFHLFDFLNILSKNFQIKKTNEDEISIFCKNLARVNRHCKKLILREIKNRDFNPVNVYFVRNVFTSIMFSHYSSSCIGY